MFFVHLEPFKLLRQLQGLRLMVKITYMLCEAKRYSVTYERIGLCDITDSETTLVILRLQFIM